MSRRSHCLATCAAIALCVAIVNTATATPTNAPSAEYRGDTLVVSAPNGTKVEILDAAEKVQHSGVVKDGHLGFKDSGVIDPMLRIVLLNGRRQSLSALFPEAELVAVLPKSAAAAQPIVPHVRAVKRGSSAPYPNLRVAIELLCRESPKARPTRYRLGSVTTDAAGIGTAPYGTLTLPDEDTKGSCRLSASGAGATVSLPIAITRGATLVVSSDRPVYQPGHTVAVRGLVLATNDGKPSQRLKSATLELLSPSGGVVARRASKISPFGLAHADLKIPASYGGEAAKVRLTVGPQSVTKRIKVGRYITPRVSVTAEPLTPSVRAGERLSVRIAVSRLDSGPVNKTPVEVRYWAAGKLLKTLTQKASADGRVVVSHILGKVAADRVSVAVRAQTPGGDVGKATLDIPVDHGQLDVFAIPESGRLVPGLRNGVWLVTLKPDGEPVSATVMLRAGDRRVAAKTDATGVAFSRISVPVRTSNLSVQATAKERRGSRRIKISGEPNGSLLHIQPVVASTGKAVTMTYVTHNGDGMATFDLVQSGQAIHSVSARLEGGSATATIQVPPHLVGTVTIHAWHIDNKGTVVGDTRLAMVNDGRDLKIVMTPDKKTYRPRQEATVSIRVTDGGGKPVVAALDLVAVDAGFRTLGLEQPGLERAMARLTKTWTKTSVPLPDWSREALVMSADHQRLAIMAAAAEAVVPLYPVRKTEAYRQSAAASAFRGSMQRRAKKLSTALTRYYKKRSRRGKRTTLKRLGDLGLFVGDLASDPWGRTMALTITPDARCDQHQLALTSRGVDGVKGTRDDIAVTEWFSGYHKKRKRCLFSRGMGAAGGGGGGGGVFYGTGARGQGSVRKPVVRSKFPETLAVARNIITDAAGYATWTVRLADSLTRWVVQARGASKAGGLGGAETELVVEQPFSVDVVLPPGLTQGDTLVVPVGVTNNTTRTRDVRVKVTATAHLGGATTATLSVPPKSSKTVSVTLVAKMLGEGSITVEATSNDVGDAVIRKVRITPDGVPVHLVKSQRVSAGIPQTIAMTVPSGGLPGTESLALRVYPSTFSAAIDGLEALLRQPTGCFEQTSSTTYPNALVLNYLKRTKTDKPKVAGKAMAFLKAGWKRLTSYEVKGGGFSWFGNAPANQVLTAFGLMEFEAMGEVMKVDRDVIERTREWLLNKRQKDGSFTPDKSHLHDWSKVQSSNLPVTAYVTWALARAGTSAKSLKPSVRWLRANADKASNGYEKGLVALALNTVDGRHKSAESARDLLASAATVAPKVGTFWSAGMATGTHSKGRWADMETTGLSVLAFAGTSKGHSHSQEGLNWLLAQRGSRGGWGTTQATVLALEGLLTVASAKPADGAMSVTVDGSRGPEMTFTRADADLVRAEALPAGKGDRKVVLNFTGKGDVNVQLEATRFVRPDDAPAVKGPLKLVMTPSKTSVSVGETVTVDVQLDASEVVRMPTVQIGLPAGFDVQTASIKGNGIAHHEVLGRTLVLYMLVLAPETPLRASYQLVARQEGDVSPGAAKAWPYYEPDKRVYVGQPRLQVQR